MFKRVQSRQELIDYAMRENGHPVIQINIAEEQLQDRVNDAVYMFQQYHMDALRKDILTLKITQENIDTQTIDLPHDIVSIVDVVYTPASTFSTNNLQYQMYFSDLISKSFISNSGMSSYAMTRSYLSIITQTVGDIYHMTDFNIHQNKLKIFSNWSKIKVGDYIGLEAWSAISPDRVSDVWDNYWLKKYTSALIKKQWGSNLMKYNMPSLVGGASINGVEIYQSANEELQKLEDRLREEFTFPPMGFMA